MTVAGWEAGWIIHWTVDIDLFGLLSVMRCSWTARSRERFRAIDRRVDQIGTQSSGGKAKLTTSLYGLKMIEVDL